jgi:hypothetical protein
MISAINIVGCERKLEILSESEELYVGVLRNLVKCLRKSQGGNTDLGQLEQALLTAGASKNPDEVGLSHPSFAIRNTRFQLLECPYELGKIELRFGHSQL